MMFWILAAAAVFVATLIALLPLFKGKTFWQPAALALIFLVPAASLWMYTEVGTPEAIDLAPPPRAETAPTDHAQGAGDMNSAIDNLRARLEANPDDLEGWVLLARSYRSQQRLDEAVQALETAHGIAPDDPFVMVELAEAWIFTSPDGQISDESLSMLQRALAIDPTQQKALWLLGIAAAQVGEYQYAIEQWESLMAMVEPDSPVAQSLQTQIDEARAALANENGAPPPEATETATADSVEAAANPAMSAPPAEPADTGEEGWQGTRLAISAGAAMPADLAARAVLYVVIRSPGPAMGPPIGVRRINGPALPLELTITDRDSMIAERKISLESEIQLQARLSLSGSPAARDGDWQSASQTVSLDSDAPVQLVLDQQVTTTE
jgi:cytochrome c-type biogenesis protein CcmH